MIIGYEKTASMRLVKKNIKAHLERILQRRSTDGELECVKIDRRGGVSSCYAGPLAPTEMRILPDLHDRVLWQNPSSETDAAFDAIGESSGSAQARASFLLERFDWAELGQWLQDRPPPREIDMQVTLRMCVEGEGEVEDKDMHRLVRWIEMPKWMSVVDARVAGEDIVVKPVSIDQAESEYVAEGGGSVSDSRTVVRKVTIQIHYVSVEGQTEIIGTVAVPDGITDDDIERLFSEWRDLASGEAADPDAEDEDEAYMWREPDTDFEFLEWLVEKHGFWHTNGLGETVTLVW